MTTLSVWILVVSFDPSQFIESYRTPDVLERNVAQFETAHDCERARSALLRGRAPYGGIAVQDYRCLAEPDRHQHDRPPLDSKDSIRHQLLDAGTP
jgi:hypothetical protein